MATIKPEHTSPQKQIPYIQIHLCMYLPTQTLLLLAEDTACYCNKQLLTTTQKNYFKIYN
jgi:hypothetical protein